MGYIYRKQIEEAEIVAINKIDLLTAGQRARLRAHLAREYPGRKVLEISALSGAGIEAWLDLLAAEESAPQGIMDMDYARYGKGEALLGWLNATIAFDGQRKIEGAALLHTLVHAVTEGLQREGISIAHFKMILHADDGSSLRVQVTRDGEKPQFAGGLDAETRGGKLLINLRAEGDPELLAATVREGLGRTLEEVPHTVEAFAHFRPGQPRPTHRVAELVG